MRLGSTYKRDNLHTLRQIDWAHRHKRKQFLNIHIESMNLTEM